MAEERRRAPSFAAFAFLGAGLYLFYRVHQALTPFLLAAAFAYVLDPAVAYFEAKGLRRSHLVVAGYLGAALFLWLAYAGLKPLIREEAATLTANAPAYMAQLQKLAVKQETVWTRKLPLPPQLAERALESVLGSGLERLQSLPSSFLILLPLLAHVVLVPFIAFFFLLDGPSGFESLIQAMPSRFVEQAIHLMSEIDTALGNYIRGIIIVAFAISLASFVGLFALGVDNALAISVLSGVSSFVPYLGAIMGALAGGAMAVYQYGTISAGLKVVTLFIGIRLADEIFLQPIIAKHSVHLHPLVFLLALILGGEIFGFLGLVFAIPAACVLKALIQVSWSWYASESGFSTTFRSSVENVPYI
jgi:predicted PurR-regulated permease PerM